MAAARAAADRDKAIAAAEAIDATEQAKIREELAKQLKTAAENFAAAATGIEKGHRGAEVAETQALTGSVKKICDSAAAALQSIQAGTSRAIAPLLAQLNALSTSLANT